MADKTVVVEDTSVVYSTDTAVSNSSLAVVSGNWSVYDSSSPYSSLTSLRSLYTQLSSDLTSTDTTLTSAIATLDTNTYSKADVDSALSTLTTSLQSYTNTATSTLGSDVAVTYETKADASTSYSTLDTSLKSYADTAVGNAESTIALTYETKTDATATENSIRTDLTSAYQSGDTAITANLSTNYYTKAENDTAITNLQTTLEASIDDSAAVFTDILNVQVSGNPLVAESTRLTNMEVTVDGYSAVVESLDSIDMHSRTFFNAINASPPTALATGDIWTVSDVYYSAPYNTENLVREWNGTSWVDLSHLQKSAFNSVYWSASSSKLTKGANGAITGWSFADGSNVESQFKISADKFSLVNANGSATPLTIDATDPDNVQMTFSGTVTFGGSTDTSLSNLDPTSATTLSTRIAASDVNSNVTSISGGTITTGTIIAAAINLDGDTATPFTAGGIYPKTCLIKADGVTSTNTTQMGGSFHGTDYGVGGQGSSTGGYFVGGTHAGVYGEANDTQPGVFGHSHKGAGVYGESVGTGVGAELFATYGVHGYSTGADTDATDYDSTSCGVKGVCHNVNNVTNAGYAGVIGIGQSDYIGHGVIGITTSSNGEWGISTPNKSYVGGGVTPFTGAHMTFALDGDTSIVGDIIQVDQSYCITVDQSYAVVSSSVTSMDRQCYGVVSTINDDVATFLPKEPCLTDRTTVYTNRDDGSIEDITFVNTLKDEYVDFVNSLSTGYKRYIVNALGEGGINVCDINGDIANGDYICSSTVAGKGMKQNDDLLHNYTVAKSLTDVTWANEVDGVDGCYLVDGHKVKMIPCTYHCG